MLSRLVFVCAAAVALAASPAGAALAGGGGGYTVTCDSDVPAAGCDVTAQTPGQAGGAGDGIPAVEGTVTGAQVCRAEGRVVPCSLPGYGWLGADGCYYEPDPTWHPPASDTADQPPPGQIGSFYDVSCLGTAGTGTAIVWLPAGAAPGPPTTPAVLAQVATNRLNLAVATIDASPPTTSNQLVNLPTWVWLAGWSGVSAQAAVPGESVTATARPTSATWSFGDGAVVVCAGPGTPFRSGDDPRAPSPTCGHTYTAPSSGQPGGVYRVTVTVTWAISWTGGGQAGSEPALSASRSTSLRVVESQAVNTAPNGSG